MMFRSMLVFAAAGAVVIASVFSDAISPEWRFNAGLLVGIAYMAVLRVILD